MHPGERAKHRLCRLEHQALAALRHAWGVESILQSHCDGMNGSGLVGTVPFCKRGESTQCMAADSSVGCRGRTLRMGVNRAQAASSSSLRMKRRLSPLMTSRMRRS